ncbi:unnamed protein product [marine sediment metagenome]|uniref:Uncharacterized protein n=1 Tax=marine sediment metagenome TaxID=412755 RepID=X1KMZ4_9ZZZZ
MWPVKKGQKSETGRQTASQPTAPKREQDTIWAEMRRLKARVQSIELAASAARRDISRIDRKQYRDNGKEPATELPTKEQAYHPSLFG